MCKHRAESLAVATLFAPERWMLSNLRLRGFRTHQVRTSVGDVAAVSAKGTGVLPPMVLLHGLGSAALHLGPLLVRLRKHAQSVLALDLPGHGDSAVPEDGLTPDSLERGMLEALDSLVLSPSVFVGNSLGGAAALRYTLARPAQVRSLVLLSPAGASMGSEDFAQFRASMSVGNRAQARALIERVFVRPPMPKAMLAWGAERKFASPSVRSLLLHSTQAHTFSAAEVRSVSAPSLLLWPKGDKVFPPGCKEFFATHLRGVSVHEPEDLGHSPYLEDLGAVTETMLRWLYLQHERADSVTEPAVIEPPLG
ncbi:MAG: alpha/beta fold hydrolase [Deltaproteobacteria bacterium]|nr:alpha/beta fold hydrolase [Deltaproteobacteria bacterium]